MGTGAPKVVSTHLSEGATIILHCWSKSWPTINDATATLMLTFLESLVVAVTFAITTTRCPSPTSGAGSKENLSMRVWTSRGS